MASLGALRKFSGSSILIDITCKHFALEVLSGEGVRQLRVQLSLAMSVI